MFGFCKIVLGVKVVNQQKSILDIILTEDE